MMVALVTLYFVDTARAACSHLPGRSDCNPVACTPGDASQTCCRPDDAGAKYCVQVKPSDMNVSNKVCLWGNLAGQTPDTNEVFNAPWVNNFACGTTDGVCNFNSESAINDNTYSQPASDTSGTKDYSVSGAPIYYAALPNVSAADRELPANTSADYYAAFNRALSRYNCEEQYSHWNCDDCRKAYARWACAITYPACDPNPCTMKKPWEYVCYQVVQKCPVTLGFTCPTVENDDRDYTVSGGNYMGLVSGAETTSLSTTVGLFVATATFVLGTNW